MKTQVFAFARIDDQVTRHSVITEIVYGKSRFGMWQQTESLREKCDGENAFLLRVKAGDWIVHVDMPTDGNFVALKAVGGY